MKTLSQFLLEGKSPYTPEVEQDIVRFHANGIHDSIKTGENFGFEHVREYVQDKHPEYPANVQTLRKHIFAPAAHNRIVDDILNKDLSFNPVKLQRGRGRRSKEGIPGIGDKEMKRMRSAKESGVPHKDIADRFGVSVRRVREI